MTKGACTLAIVHTIEVPGLRVPFDVREHPELGLGVSVAQIHANSMHFVLSETTRHLRHVGQATERELDESFVTLPVLWRVYDRSYRAEYRTARGALRDALDELERPPCTVDDELSGGHAPGAQVVSELSRALVLRSAAAAEKSKLPEVANLLQRNETLTAELADARQRITALEAQIADFESLDYVSEDEVREIRPKKKRRVDTQYVKVKRENEEQSAALETARLALGCAICQDVLEAPVSLPCGHAFCFDCIYLHFNSGDVYSRKCPTCRAIMPPCTRRRTFNKNATLNAVVGAITERQNAPGA